MLPLPGRGGCRLVEAVGPLLGPEGGPPAAGRRRSCCSCGHGQLLEAAQLGVGGGAGSAGARTRARPRARAAPTCVPARNIVLHRCQNCQTQVLPAALSLMGPGLLQLGVGGVAVAAVQAEGAGRHRDPGHARAGHLRSWTNQR